MSAVQDVSHLGRFWSRLKFLSPRLSLGVEGLCVFLGFPPKYFGVLWVVIEEESGIDVAVFLLSAYIVVPIA